VIAQHGANVLAEFLGREVRREPRIGEHPNRLELSALLGGQVQRIGHAREIPIVLQCLQRVGIPASGD